MADYPEQRDERIHRVTSPALAPVTRVVVGIDVVDIVVVAGTRQG
jgi:uncharacterized protein YggT (Ycf19 family)